MFMNFKKNYLLIVLFIVLILVVSYAICQRTYRMDPVQDFGCLISGGTVKIFKAGDFYDARNFDSCGKGKFCIICTIGSEKQWSGSITDKCSCPIGDCFNGFRCIRNY